MIIRDAPTDLVRQKATNAIDRSLLTELPRQSRRDPSESRALPRALSIPPTFLRPTSRLHAPFRRQIEDGSDQIRRLDRLRQMDLIALLKCPFVVFAARVSGQGDGRDRARGLGGRSPQLANQ